MYIYITLVIINQQLYVCVCVKPEREQNVFLSIPLLFSHLTCFSVLFAKMKNFPFFQIFSIWLSKNNYVTLKRSNFHTF
jgi:hypothetical protein